MVPFINLKVENPNANVQILPNEIEGFGKIDAEKFRVSSIFNLNGKSEVQRLAYAMVDAIVLYQPQSGNSDLINVILKPQNTGEVLREAKVSYIIYREYPFGIGF